MDIKSLKDKILQLAIQGKLVPQNENDEPASVLLEKIKAEKEQLIKDKIIKKEKPLPEISEEEKSFDLPKGWEWCRLGEIVELRSGNSYELCKDDDINKIMYIKVSDMNTKENFYSINTSENYVSKLLIKPNSIIPKGSIIFPKRGGAILTNKKRLVLKEEILVDTNTMAIIVPYELNIYYTKYWFDSIDLGKLVSGTSVPQINNKDINPLIIPLPPLEEQKRIVAKVDELFELIDKLDSSKQELLENISNTRNKVLRLAIQGKLVEQGEDDEPASVLLERIKVEKEQLIKDKIIKKEKPLPDISEEEKSFDLPKGWEWCRLGQLYNIVRGSSPRPKGHPKYFTESKTEYNWVTIKDITLFLDGKYLYNTNEYLTYEGSLKSRFIKSGEIIIAVSGSIGKTAIMGTDGYIYDGLAGLKNIVDNEILRDYIYIALNAWKEHLNNISEGTSIQNINTEKLNLLNIALPPLEEQKRIVEKFDLIMDYLDKLQQEIESQEVILEDILK